MMEALEIAVLVGVLVLAGRWMAPRAGVPAPMLQLMLGLLAGFVPAVRGIHLPSEAVLVLFLPGLLFWEALTTSLPAVRRDLRIILLLSTLLVVVSAAGIAGIGVACGLGWGASLVLGAALAPTDATAVGVMAGALPHRNLTQLRAEGLVNDGTALVLYAVAVGMVVGRPAYTGWHVAGLVVLAYVGGAAIGAAAGFLGTILLRRRGDRETNAIALVVMPFAAFLAASLIGASGVIAVVVAGLALGRSDARAGSPRARRQAYEFWSLTTSILNGALFVLIGIEAQSAVRAVGAGAFPALIILSALAWAALLLVRFAFQMIAMWFIRLLDRRPVQRTRRMSHRARVVSAVAGFRGAVSLALALAVPAVIAGRAEIVFVATGVVILTLVVQGMLLPAVVRWARFAPDPASAPHPAPGDEPAWS